MFETGHKLENSLSFSGGSNRTTYYLSLGRTTTNGVAKGNSDYLRNSFRLKASQQITSGLWVTGNVSVAAVESNRIQRGSNAMGLMLAALRTPPDFDNEPHLDPETGYHRSYQVPEPASAGGSRGFDNPFFVLSEHTNLSEVTRFFGNATIDYDPRPWINLSYRLGHDFSSDQRRTVFPIGSSGFPSGRIVRDEFTSRETDSNLLVTVRRGFVPAEARLTVMAGQNLNQQDFRVFTTRGDGIAVDGFDQLGSTASFSTLERQETVRIEGYFAQAQIDLWDQLYLTLGVRNDGASVFSGGKKRHWYPKLSTSWVFSDLGDLQGARWLSFGKVRAAYGETGRIPAAYSALTRFVSEPFPDNRGETLNPTAYGHAGFVTDRIRGQENIKPERAKEFELGCDLGFIDGRVGLDFTYYNQSTSDVIYSLPQPPSTGFISQFQNAGTITNKGIEVGVHCQPIGREILKWDLGLTFARNRNKVTELPDATFVSLGPFPNLEGGKGATEGYPFGVLLGSDYIRFGRSSAVQGIDIDSTYTGWNSGDLYISESGYPIVDPEARIISDPNPDWTGSIRTGVTLHSNLRLSTLIEITQGGDMWNGTRGALLFFGTHKDTEDRDGTQIFEGVGPGQGMPVSKGEEWYTRQAGSLFTGVNSPFTEDGSYVKLREVSASYTFRNDFMKRVGISDVQLRLSARNLKTWTGYTGINVEGNFTGQSNIRGSEFMGNPATRSFTFSVRMNH